MQIIWYGHSCFALTNDSNSVVFDPYEPEYVPGLRPLNLKADKCLSSHEHGDHYYPEAVDVSGAKDLVWKISSLATFHDEVQGRKRGRNTIYIVEADGWRIAHLGDLGHLLSSRQLSELGDIDVLMIPVGGYYTIDGQQAAELVQQIRPRIVLPMHYRSQRMGFGFDNIAELDGFVSLFPADKIVYYDDSSLMLSDNIPQQIAVLRPERLMQR